MTSDYDSSSTSTSTSSRSTGDNQNLPPQILLFSDDFILKSGLNLLGWTDDRLAFKRRSPETNRDQYRGMFGVNPYVTARLCEDLQISLTAEAQVESKDLNLDKLHWTLYWLYRYPTETKQESI